MPPIGAVVSSSRLLDFEPAAALGTRNTFAIASGLDEDAALLAVYLDVPVSFSTGVWACRFTARLTASSDSRTGCDVAEAEAAIDRLAAAPADEGLVIREVWLLRMRALLARVRGEKTGYRDYRDRYRAMATSLGFEGHMKWAEAMP
jgi:hypothetical protein